ncbi:TlyA family RNA methyltransferase [Myxosarcina sp. GI1]|uniref:TlyA family RNA methyltransferase n=1 Tax=Myxosarcina sp. GI1 TaxID=1541065 RepID=UPI0005679B8B
MTKQRLDTLLVSLNFCNSRAVAQRYIRAGEVTVDDRLIDKPGTEVDVNAAIVLKQKPPYVSRGGEKLAEALKTFDIDVNGRICLDGGISTGGFTDCLLQAGAALVYGVDVGYGQVAWSLRQSDRVILKERTNFRYLTPQELYGDCDRANLGVMDLSFISLTKVLANLRNFLASPHEVVLLVKPQFEVGKDKVGKNGVIRNPQHRAEAIYRVWQVARDLGWQYQGLIPSPLRGPAGNIEYLLWLKTHLPEQPINSQQIEKIISEVANISS